MVSGLVLRSTIPTENRSDVELAQGPVLDVIFQQNGTIAFFCKHNVTIFLVSCFLAPAMNNLQYKIGRSVCARKNVPKMNPKCNKLLQLG